LNTMFTVQEFPTANVLGLRGQLLVWVKCESVNVNPEMLSSFELTFVSATVPPFPGPRSQRVRNPSSKVRLPGLKRAFRCRIRIC